MVRTVLRNVSTDLRYCMFSLLACQQSSTRRIRGSGMWRDRDIAQDGMQPVNRIAWSILVVGSVCALLSRSFRAY